MRYILRSPSPAVSSSSSCCVHSFLSRGLSCSNSFARPAYSYSSILSSPAVPLLFPASAAGRLCSTSNAGKKKNEAKTEEEEEAEEKESAVAKASGALSGTTVAPTNVTSEDEDALPEFLRRQSAMVKRERDLRRLRESGGDGDGSGSLDEASGSGVPMSASAVDPSVALSFSDPLTMPRVQPDEVDERFKDVVVDRGALRPTGQWSVEHTTDAEQKTVSFSMIDELDLAASEVIADADRAIISVEEENKYKNKLMFVNKFKKTPKHLTWKELSQEIDTIDCDIDLDPNRPEEVYRMSFFFVHKRSGRRQMVWTAANDVSYSEGLTDLLAAVGSCLGRADVHRTIRFDSGKGETRDLNIRKNSRYTSEVMLAFRPPSQYDLYERTEGQNAWEKEMDEKEMPQWGYHPRMMDPEYRDTDDPLGSYHIAISAHAFSYVVLRAIDRLLARPLKDFYRPSQVARTQKVSSSEDIGIVHAVMGWLGVEERTYPHYTPMDAVQDHWFGADAPFTLVAIINKLRESTYLKRQNPEFQSWLAVRRRDTAVAVRGIRAKLLGVGSSRLFMPMSYDPTVNRLLPKRQQRTIKAQVSIGAMLGMPDQTKHIGEVQKIANGDYKLEEGDTKEADEGKSSSPESKTEQKQSASSSSSSSTTSSSSSSSSAN